MVAGENVAEQERYPNLCEGGHASAHGPHSSLCSGTGEILPQYA